MSNPYHELREGPTRASALGRSSIVEQINGKLERTHVSIVGPHDIGKTCLLLHLAEVNADENTFSDIAFWDMHHPIVTNDEEFYRALADVFSSAISNPTYDASNYFFTNQNQTYRGISEFFDFVAENNDRILIVLDSMDDAISSGSITVDVWNNMCALSDKKSVTFLTGSRKRLYELCDTRELRGSHFWERLKDPIEVGALNESQIDEFLAPLEEIATIESGGRKEILNWTGGIPSLLLRICGCLYDEASAGTTQISNGTVNSVANTCATDAVHDLRPIWEECSTAAQGIYIKLVETGETLLADAGEPGRELILRGLGKVEGNKIKPSCRLLEDYSKSQETGMTPIRALFQEDEDYARNLQSLVTVRLQNLVCPDGILRDAVEDAIKDVGNPNVCIRRVRGILDSAFEVIWQVEAPDGLVKDWGVSDDDLPEPGRAIPSDFSDQLRMIRKILERRTDWEPEKINRKISCLLSYSHTIGNFGQHQRGSDRQIEEVSTNFSASYCLIALQLIEELAAAGFFDDESSTYDETRIVEA